MISISLCMIVKNEEKVLSRCLDSLKGLMDEIIIVDTGSTDRTKEIARQYTDKVYDFFWCEDFAAARNFSFSKATMEYIYAPDADEYLDETNGAWLMGDRERSRYYNHSTFNDLVITGIVGLRPQADGSIVVNPLMPEGTWTHFCLDNVSYHGNNITIIYDESGTHYHQGKGLILLVNGKKVAQRTNLGMLKYSKEKAN